MKLTQSGQKAKKRAKKSVIFGSFLRPLKSSFYIVDSHKCQKRGQKRGVKKVTKNDHFWAKIDPFLTPFLPGHRGQRGQWVKKRGYKNDPKNAKNDHFWAKIDPFLTPFLPGHRGQRGQLVKKRGSKNGSKMAKNGQKWVIFWVPPKNLQKKFSYRLC